MIRSHKSESGQALVLIVLGMIVMLGFAALAIDGGRVYAARRTMQNASDTASLTGGGRFAQYFSENQILFKNWDCSGTWFNAARAVAYSAAITRAQTNGYSIDTDVSDNNGVTAVCGTTSYVGFTDKYIDVTTWITADTPSSFAQFVFGGPLRQTVISVARIRPQTAGGFGNAIVALNPAACQGNQNGAQFDGNNDLIINGGGVFSQGCMGVNGTALDIDVINGTSTYMYSPLSVSGSPSVDPWPAQGNEPLPDEILQIPTPDCSGLPNRNWSNGVNQPGVYNQALNPTGNANITLNPGLYCVNASITINSGKLTGTGVTIYMVSGNFKVGGSPQVVLSAPLASPAAAPAIPGVVIYLAPNNTGEVVLLGNSASSYTGTIYAPKGKIEIGGSAGLQPTYNTQLIGWNVFVHGTADININFDDAVSYQYPPRLDLQR